MTAPAARSFCATAESCERLGAEQRERAGGGHHSVGGIDVVFDQHRDAVHRAARAFGFALLIEGIGDGECVGIHLDDGVDRGAILIDLGDAG